MVGQTEPVTPRARATSDPVKGGASRVRRACLTGAESTGKTTLCQLLAERHATTWMHEYGRDHTIEKIKAGTNDEWTTHDFVVIAQRQQQLEDEAAERADGWLFCDTDALATALWHERYLGYRSEEVEAIAAGRTYDLFVLCDIDVPFERDGVRFGEMDRPRMHDRFVEELAERPEPWILVSGSLDERYAAVEAAMARVEAMR
jgi:HTH-type transcriptional regulator, transcriptional repressor of NAD biosynthesis genes